MDGLEGPLGGVAHPRRAGWASIAPRLRPAELNTPSRGVRARRGSRVPDTRRLQSPSTPPSDDDPPSFPLFEPRMAA
ncbi:hypothetical protein PtB15_7B335 [Puccinia triticina]|nr:hypothetical protein PtB15_7B335 [Puccinia triticina]